MVNVRRASGWGISLVLLAAGGIWWLWQPSPTVREHREEPKVRAEEEPVRVPRPAWTIADESRKPVVPGPEMAADEPIPLPAWHEEALEGEATVFFADDAARERFVESARAAGIPILGVSPRLGVVRVGVNPEELGDLLGEADGVDFNYRVRVPSPPEAVPPVAGEMQPVGADLLHLLGITDRESWRSWGEGVRIAVLDSGWQGHGAVDAGSVQFLDMLTGESVEGNFSGHGTAVAGLIGSREPFAAGVAPGSDLLSVRVLDGQGQGNAFTLAEGIVEAVDAGARVVNMSLGSYADSRVLRNAVDYATEQGALLVAAAGNDGAGRLTYPAAYEHVLGVGAVDASGQRAAFSNAGSGLDLVAPGYQVHALWGEDGFVAFGGTSAASAVVAGLAGRVWQEHPRLNGADVRSILEAQANAAGPPDRDPQYGAGIVDAGRLERRGDRSFTDMALADLYPALEQADGASFPLYVTFENRGGQFLPPTRAQLEVNGLAYHYSVPGLEPGAESHVEVSVPLSALEGGDPFRVRGEVAVPEGLRDDLPKNNAGEILLRAAAPADADEQAE